MSKVIYLSHGGGPLPLLERDIHKNMLDYYREYGNRVHPKAIVVVSAHYETNVIEVIYDHPKEVLFDYYGFPPESYTYKYSPPINKQLGETILKMLNDSGIKAVSGHRGFDHGVFIPLMIMFPKADIPVIQVSLKKGLDETEHINLGKALSSLDDDILIIGSGSSFHNLREYFSDQQITDVKNDKFHDALKKLMTEDMDESEREDQLINWRKLPEGTFCHPRSEHLIPLHVCYGIKQAKGIVHFDDKIYYKRSICIEWE